MCGHWFGAEVSCGGFGSSSHEDEVIRQLDQLNWFSWNELESFNPRLLPPVALATTRAVTVATVTAILRPSKHKRVRGSALWMV